MEPNPEEPVVEASIEDGIASFIVLSPHVDLESSAQLRSALVEAIGSESVSRVVIDLGNVEFMDANGLGVMVGALKRLREKNKSLLLRNTISASSTSVQRVLELTGLTGTFEIENPTQTNDQAQ